MKNTLIVLVVVIAIAAIGFFMWQQNNTKIGDKSATSTSDMNDHDMGAMSSDETNAETNDTNGSDVGMEFPTIDAGVTVDAHAKVFAVGGTSNMRFNPSEIRVKEGDMVTINFTSNGGFHDFVIDEFDARTERVQPGTQTSVTFVADTKGTFEYYCSVGNHRAMGMVGKLVVE